MKKYIDIISGFGFSVGEARVYLALLSKESLSASEVAEISGVSRQMAYTVLQKLQKKGFCSLISGNTKLFRAASPTIVITDLMRQYSDHLKNIKSVLGDLEELYEQSQSVVRPLEYIEILKDKKLIVDRFFRLISSTKKKVDIFAKGPFALGKDLSNPPGEEALQRGIKVRAIYEMSDITVSNLMAHFEKFTSLGEEGKIISGLPMKLAVFDDERVLIALKDPITGKPSLTSLVIEHSDYARSMTILFDHYWQISIPPDEFFKNRTNQDHFAD